MSKLSPEMMPHLKATPKAHTPMSGTTKTIIWVTALLAVGVGVFWYFKRQYDLLYNYCYRIKQAKFSNISGTNVKLEMKMLIRNISDITINLTGYDFDVYVNGIFVSKVTNNIKQQLVAKGVSELDMFVMFNPKEVLNFKNILEFLSQTLLQKDKITIRIKGTASGSVGFLSVANLPIDITETLAQILADDPEAEYCKV